MNLRGRSFLTLLDYSPEEIRYLLDLSHALKREKKERVFPERLKHKNIVLIFDKTSTRTRCAFEVAALDEGAQLIGVQRIVENDASEEADADNATDAESANND